MRCLDGLDHTLIATHDLAQCARQFEKLGFTTTPLGRHEGWATGNHCVMFEENYLELLGRIMDGDVPPAVAKAFDHGEGPMGLALTSSDPASTYEAWTQQGLEPAEPQALARKLDGEDDLRFQNVMLETNKTGGFPIFACHHLTPEALRPAQFLKHANGALGIRSCTIAVDDPAPVTEAFRKILGSSTHSGTDQVSAFQIGDAAIVVALVEDAALMHPAFTLPESLPEPRLMVLTIGVASIPATAAHFEQQGIPFKTLLDETLAVQPDYAGGVMLEFVATRT